MSKQKIYVGTSGWSYKDWIDCFYPKSEATNFEWLEFYSQYFNTVEIESSMSPVTPAMVDEWIDKVSARDEFLFNYKLPRAFTSTRSFRIIHVESVCTNLKMLNDANRLGRLLIQFPYSFTFSDENAGYVAKLADIFSDFEIVIEVRHKSWVNESFLNFLGNNNSALCAIDLPQIEKVLEFKPVVTCETLYIHLYGRNESAWIKEFSSKKLLDTPTKYPNRYHYFYSPGELLEIEYAINKVGDSVKKIFVVLYNHTNGHAVANALELFSLLNGRMKIPVPFSTLKTFTRLSKISLP